VVKKSVVFENGDNDPFELKNGLHNPNNVQKARKKEKKKVSHSDAGQMITEEHKRIKSKKRQLNESASSSRGETQQIVVAEPTNEYNNKNNGMRKEHRPKRSSSKNALRSNRSLRQEEEGLTVPVRSKQRIVRR
jgi:hypothetical protein